MSYQKWKNDFVFWITLKPTSTTFRDGTERLEFNTFDRLYNTYFPTEIMKHKNGNLESISYMNIKFNHVEPTRISYYTSGKIKAVGYHMDYSNKDLRREQCLNNKSTKFASHIRYYENGNIKYKHYFDYYYLYIKSKLNKVLPYSVGFYENGNLKWERYLFISHEEVPKDMNYTEVEYYESGTIKNLRYKIGNVECVPLPDIRNDKYLPSYREFYENGGLKLKRYQTNEKYHNSEGPALVEYYSNGVVKKKEFYTRGQHQYLGAISYYKSGNKKQECYYSTNGRNNLSTCFKIETYSDT